MTGDASVPSCKVQEPYSGDVIGPEQARVIACRNLQQCSLRQLIQPLLHLGQVKFRRKAFMVRSSA